MWELSFVSKMFPKYILMSCRNNCDSKWHRKFKQNGKLYVRENKNDYWKLEINQKDWN